MCNDVYIITYDRTREALCMQLAVARQHRDRNREEKESGQASVARFGT